MGVQTFLQSSQDINVGGRAGRAQYQYTLADANLDELNIWGPKLLAKLQTLPELKDVNSDQQSHAAAVMLDIDRNAAARFGIATADIDNAVYNLLGQREVTQYFTQLNAYHVVRRGAAADADRSLDPELGLSALAADRKERAAVAVREDRIPTPRAA